MDGLMELLGTIGGILWGPWTPWALLTAGVLATVFTRFTQVTAMTHGVAVVRGVYDDPNDPGAINHFQALSAALSATVGLGNIGGVALAIGAGGPGALVWMWIVGFFGMALKTVEITLAMMYRNTDDPENPSGGAMWVVDKVIGGKGGIWIPIAKVIGIFFCITLLISTFTGGNMFQSWSVATLTQEFFGVDKLISGIMLAVIVGLVIIGGIKRIGNVAGRLVPFMCAIYVLAALAVLAMNVTELPGLFGDIFRSAFSADEGHRRVHRRLARVRLHAGHEACALLQRSGPGLRPDRARRGEDRRTGARRHRRRHRSVHRHHLHLHHHGARDPLHQHVEPRCDRRPARHRRTRRRFGCRRRGRHGHRAHPGR